jgi:hypothetical protein
MLRMNSEIKSLKIPRIDVSPFPSNTIQTYEDPEKAAAEPMVAIRAATENFMIIIDNYLDCF